MNTKNIAIAVLVIIVLALFARYVVFKEQFNEWGDGLERVGEWEDNYRTENPNASDEEVEAAFDSGIAEITLWKERYKQENPGATDAEADAAFEAAWDNN